MAGPDIRILWLNVHGGAFHKLIRLHEELLAAGHSCELVFCVDAPRGLKIGADIPLGLLPQLKARGVFFLDRAESLRRALAQPPRLLVTEAHHDQDLPRLLAQARERGVSTAQIATLMTDFSCHGADYLLLQHPLTLFFELEYSRTRESRLLSLARRIFFTGNIFFEPTVNRLVNDYPSRAAFCEHYGFDPTRPICLWLPNSVDVLGGAYEGVIQAVRGADMNLAVKLHPWEYAFKKHGVDPWGFGRTSDEIWGLRAVDEPDSTWAYRFCDLAVMRGSATILEMPFWEKPCLHLPATAYSKLVDAQARLAVRSSILLESVGALGDFLQKRPLPAFTPADYAAARAAVRLDPDTDAYTLTVRAIGEILTQPAPPPIGSMARIKGLYDGLVPPEFERSLSATRRARFVLGRALRRLCPR